MCGIAGFLGQGPAAGPIIEALRRLEYRGYDSAGIATLEQGRLVRRRAVGKLIHLEHRLTSEPLYGRAGIGHTRWATHGKPNEINAHPHTVGDVAVVHNGIIENHRELRNEMVALGACFTTDTDSEVIAHLVDQQLRRGQRPVQAVRQALSRLDGAFALAFLFQGHEDLIIAARKGSPLAVGYGANEMYLGSDAIALAPLTQKISYLEDGDIAVIGRQSIHFIGADGTDVQRPLITIAPAGVVVDKGVHQHFMRKEIYEQPTVVAATLSQFLDIKKERIRFPEQERMAWNSVDGLSMSACGTSYYAASVARYWFERYAKLPVQLDIASEFRYRDVPLKRGNLAIFISQSGETADTIASLNLAKAMRQRILSVVNVQTSTMARASEFVVPTLAGTEVGVASTKAFTCQLAVLLCLAIAAGRERGVLSRDEEREFVRILSNVEQHLNTALELEPSARATAHLLAQSSNALFLGRGTSFPIALEGALKLKEITYIHAEGYAAGELKHGPIALVDRNTPVIVLAPFDSVFEKTISNMHEVIAREGRAILFTDQRGAAFAPPLSAPLFNLGAIPPLIMPLALAIPLQLIAYHTALILGTDIDKPRNLAKSVTVE